MPETWRLRAPWILLVVLLVPVLWSVGAWAVRPKDEVFLAKASGECVGPPEVMRPYHPAYLFQERDYTVRGTIVKGERHVLARCASCHTDRSQFCDRCHAAANVNLDCFECHQDFDPAENQGGTP